MNYKRTKTSTPRPSRFSAQLEEKILRTIDRVSTVNPPKEERRHKE